MCVCVCKCLSVFCDCGVWTRGGGRVSSSVTLGGVRQSPLRLAHDRGLAQRMDTSYCTRFRDGERKGYDQNFSPTPGIAIARNITSTASGANDLELHPVDILLGTSFSSGREVA
jgi:hypothetical protein